MSNADKPIEELQRLTWRAAFWKTVQNQSAPTGKIDMYLIVDDDTGEGIVSLGVPHGRDDIAKYVARCCNAGGLGG